MSTEDTRQHLVIPCSLQIPRGPHTWGIWKVPRDADWWSPQRGSLQQGVQWPYSQGRKFGLCPKMGEWIAITTDFRGSVRLRRKVANILGEQTKDSILEVFWIWWEPLVRFKTPRPMSAWKPGAGHQCCEVPKFWEGGCSQGKLGQWRKVPLKFFFIAVFMTKKWTFNQQRKIDMLLKKKYYCWFIPIYI